MDHLLFDQNPNPMWIYDLDSLGILKVNNAATELYGYSKEEFENLTFRDISAPEVLLKLEKDAKELKDKGTVDSGINKHLNKQGEALFVKVQGQKYPYKDFNSRLVTITDVSEVVKAEEKVQKLYEELNHHVMHSPLGVIKWDKDLHIQEWSQRAREISGYTADEVVGKSPFVFNFFDEHEIKRVKKIVRDLIEQKVDRSQFETVIRHKDGAKVHIQVYSSTHRGEDGSLDSVVSLVEDISERKKSELKYEKLFENANDGIFIMKGDKFVDCNKKVEEIFGSEKDEIIGSTPFDFSPDKQPDGQLSTEKGEAFIKKVLEDNPQEFEWKHKKKDGSLVDVRVSLNKLELGGENFIQSIVRDISKEKETELEMRKRETLFRNLFLEAPAAMAMVNTENKTLMVNESFERLFGYAEDELIGKDIDEFIVPERERGTALKMPAIDFEGESLIAEKVRYTKSRERKDVLMAAIPVYFKGKPLAGFGMYIDITDRKESEARLKKSLKEKQVMLEEIHHRVKNNLAVISSMLELQKFEADNEKLSDALHDSQLRIKSIALIHEMLYKSENLSEIEFATYVDQLVEAIMEALPIKSKHINVNVESEEVRMNINQAIPCALIINELVTNAFQHAFNGETGMIGVKVDVRKDHIFVEVSDNGKGLPQKFTLEKSQSLGLKLVDALCEQLGADLDYGNREGSYFNYSFSLEESKKGSASLHF